MPSEQVGALIGCLQLDRFKPRCMAVDSSLFLHCMWQQMDKDIPRLGKVCDKDVQVLI